MCRREIWAGTLSPARRLSGRRRGEGRLGDAVRDALLDVGHGLLAGRDRLVEGGTDPLLEVAAQGLDLALDLRAVALDLALDARAVGLDDALHAGAALAQLTLDAGAGLLDLAL